MVTRRANAPHLVQPRRVTTPRPDHPQPRDIALEQETAEVAAHLEAQSDAEPTPSDES